MRRLSFVVFILLQVSFYPLSAQNTKSWGEVYVSAMRYYNDKEWDKAILQFKSAIAIDPTKRITYTNLLYAHLYKTASFSDADFNTYIHGEINYFNTLISKKPGLGIYYSARSNYYDLLQEFDKELNDLTKAIQCNPADSFFYFKRGMIYQDRFAGKYDLALTDYKKAIALHCTDTTLYRRMDKIYRRTKSTTELVKALEELVTLTNRKQALPLVLLGNAYEESGNINLAGTAYDAAYKIDQSPDTYALAIATAQKQIEAAGKSINQQSASIPNSDSALAEAAKRRANAPATSGTDVNGQNPVMSPKVSNNNTCPYCGGSGKVEKFGTHLGYVDIVDSQGRKIGSNYQTITDFHYETCTHCGGLGKLY